MLFPSLLLISSRIVRSRQQSVIFFFDKSINPVFRLYVADSKESGSDSESLSEIYAIVILRSRSNCMKKRKLERILSRRKSTHLLLIHNCFTLLSFYMLTIFKSWAYFRLSHYYFRTHAPHPLKMMRMAISFTGPEIYFSIDVSKNSAYSVHSS